MQEEQRKLNRAVDATLIPQGDLMRLPEGEIVTITHRLGGNFTVMTHNGMFRIKGADADALNESVPVATVECTVAGHDGPPCDDKIWEQLRSVYDPEIPVNIVDLGLIYTMEKEALPPLADGASSGYHVKVAMTLTAPGCGMGPAIAEDAKMRIETVPGVKEATVDIVWEPPWSQDMISEEGKMQLGLV
jgi:probable FeS assembly SUF system protein SufT